MYLWFCGFGFGLDGFGWLVGLVHFRWMAANSWFGEYVGCKGVGLLVQLQVGGWVWNGGNFYGLVHICDICIIWKNGKVRGVCENEKNLTNSKLRITR